MTQSQATICLNKELTQEITSMIRQVIAENPTYEAAKQITKRFLGSRKVGESMAMFGFWVPGLVDGALIGKAGQIKLELFTPLEPLDFSSLKKNQPLQTRFRHDLLQLMVVDNYMVGVVNNVQIGTREQAGSFYWLRYSDYGESYIIRDPLVQSSPFGIYAPAELFDIEGMLANRKDMDYFKSWYKTIYPDGTYRAKDVGTHLEIHTETATMAGTIAALSQQYREIGHKIQANIDADKENIYEGLTPAEMNFVGFDSIELTPEVPPAERESEKHESGEFFQVKDKENDQVTIQLKRPDISNWGYDTPIVGSAAVNPSISDTLRPDEFLEFIETIHTMPGRPIQLCIDSVLGHCDFQGARLLETFDKVSEDRTNLKYVNSRFLRGPNMYGRDIDFAEPNVKAMLLELLVRKLNFGFDCVRVDGAQDFIIQMDEETGLRIQDDEFLNEMANVLQDINGLTRRLDFNLEDGRPWPDDLNWIYNSKYLDHTIERTQPFGDRVKQWSPIIFAHNVHGKFKWFMSKWDRFVEVFRYGENWITGHSNHDNARYFYRMVSNKPSREYRPGKPFEQYYNDQLGTTMTEVAHNAMDHNGLTALSLGFLPGNPMFLLNALFHTPWLFMRDIDDTYDVKIVGDEGARFFTWYVDEALYSQPEHFTRLKALGFSDYHQLVDRPGQKVKAPAFLDVLSQLAGQIKTDALMARFLFDDPDDAGGYPSVVDLKAVYSRIVSPVSEEDHNHRTRLIARVDADPRETSRRVNAARKLISKNLRFLTRDREAAPDDVIEGIVSQIQKIDFLQTVDDRSLALLIEDADVRSEYNVATWAAHEQLNALAPDGMKQDGRLTVASLKSFSIDFMHDARDAAKVPHYTTSIDPAQVNFNFETRLFRQRNPWLLSNPTNDVRRDYFSRKLFINGAKDVGDWGDKGDVVKCNTIYYGWRTSPDGKKQVFLIANMEGQPIEKCPLNLFLNLSGTWNVVVHSPTMTRIPPQIDKNFIIENFKNGEALLLERSTEYSSVI
jgi:hypothetical protein